MLKQVKNKSEKNCDKSVDENEENWESWIVNILPAMLLELHSVKYHVFIAVKTNLLLSVEKIKQCHAKKNCYEVS